MIRSALIPIQAQLSSQLGLLRVRYPQLESWAEKRVVTEQTNNNQLDPHMTRDENLSRATGERSHRSTSLCPGQPLPEGAQSLPLPAPATASNSKSDSEMSRIIFGEIP